MSHIGFTFPSANSLSLLITISTECIILQSQRRPVNLFPDVWEWTINLNTLLIDFLSVAAPHGRVSEVWIKFEAKSKRPDLVFTPHPYPPLTWCKFWTIDVVDHYWLTQFTFLIYWNASNSCWDKHMIHRKPFILTWLFRHCCIPPFCNEIHWVGLGMIWPAAHASSKLFPELH